MVDFPIAMLVYRSVSKNQKAEGSSNVGGSNFTAF